MDDCAGPLSYTFNAKSKRDSIGALVNVIEIANKYRDYLDHPPYGFNTRLDLIRGEKSYKISLVPTGNMRVRASFHSLSDVESAEPVMLKGKVRKNFLYANFRDGCWFHVEFLHDCQHEYFKKVMREFLHLRQYILSTRNNQISRPKIKIRDFCTQYKIPGTMGSSDPKEEGKKKSGGGLSSFGKISDTVSVLEELDKQFYEIHAKNWKLNHTKNWFDHILIQVGKEGDEDDEIRIISLYEHLGAFVYTKCIETYFTPQTVLNEKEEELEENNFAPRPEFRRNYQDLLKAIITYEKTQTCPEELLPILSDEVIRCTVKRECELINGNHGLFNIHLYLIVRKLMKVMVPLYQNAPQYFSLEKTWVDMFTQYRHLWCVDDCRDRILSLLIHRKPFEEVVKELESQFFDLEAKTFVQQPNEEEDEGEDLLEESNDNNEEEEEEAFMMINPEEWEKFMREFSNTIGLKMDDISHRIKLAKEQNDYRKQRKKNQVEYEKVKINLETQEKFLEALKLETTTTGKKYEKIQSLILDIELKEMESEEAAIVVSDELKKLKKEADELEIKMLQTSMKKMEAENKLNFLRSKTKKLEHNIREDIPGKSIRAIQHQKENHLFNQETPKLFLASKKRRMAIRSYFMRKLKQLTRGKISEFSVKLVISIYNDYEVPWFQKVLGGVMNRISVNLPKLKPSYFQYGFVHTNCQISNLCAQWSSDEFVNLSHLNQEERYDDYECIIAVDCHCPMIVNNHYAAYQRIQALSEEIINTNLDYEYEQMNVVGRKGRINCQEFSMKLMNALNYTPFFEQVTTYLEDLNKSLTKKSKQEATDLRFLTVSEKFRKVYQNIWKLTDDNKKKKGKNKKKNKKKGQGLDESTQEHEEENIKSYKPDKKNRIYFNSHEEVDVFYMKCIQLKDDIQLRFPGEYAILKGFDRSFWMMKKENEKDVLRPGGCPFLDFHKEEEKEGGEEEH